MIKADFNIPSVAGLFLDAFGITLGGVYKPEAGDGKADDPTTKAPFFGVEYVEDKQVQELSSLGTAIIFPLYFSAGAYNEYNSKGEIIRTQMNDFRLPIASIVSFRRDKIMNSTKMNGGHSTVKEVYGFDDWQVTINGFLLPDKSQPQGFINPLDQEKQLKKWDDLASSVEVLGKPFETLGIKNLTIKGINFEPMRGKPNIRAFTINALSDEPIELNIKSSV